MRNRCEILLYCTDRYQGACQLLVNETQDTSLFKEDAIGFGHLSIPELVELNMIEAIDCIVSNFLLVLAVMRLNGKTSLRTTSLAYEYV